MTISLGFNKIPNLIWVSTLTYGTVEVTSYHDIILEILAKMSLSDGLNRRTPSMFVSMNLEFGSKNGLHLGPA